MLYHGHRGDKVFFVAFVIHLCYIMAIDTNKESLADLF